MTRALVAVPEVSRSCSSPSLASSVAMTRAWWLVLVAALACGLGCKAPNEAFCCITEQDCAANGVNEIRPCDDGLACKQNACVAPTCSTEGCSAAAPVCDTVTDECTGCTESAECSRFDGSDVCDIATGACVECLSNADCSIRTPVCEGNACRVCEEDGECPSGACAKDGSCVAENDVGYVDPTGTDSGNCSRESPCLTLRYAVGKTSAARQHVVLATAIYTIAPFNLDSSTTPAPEVTIHGGGATIMSQGSGGGEPMLGIHIPTTLKELTLEYDGGIGNAITSTAPCVLRRLTVRSRHGLFAISLLDISDFRFESTGPSGGSAGIGLGSGANMTLSRGVLIGGERGIRSAASTTVKVTNVLVANTTETGIELASNYVNADLSFVTVVNTGTAATDAAGITCIDRFSQRITSSIVWTPVMPGSTVPPIGNTCSVTSSIAGPIGVVGGENVDPRFVNAAGGDFHIGDNSPAIDRVDLGPDHDFEGDARPNGTRFDLGADERR